MTKYKKTKIFFMIGDMVSIKNDKNIYKIVYISEGNCKLQNLQLPYNIIKRTNGSIIPTCHTAVEIENRTNKVIREYKKKNKPLLCIGSIIQIPKISKQLVFLVKNLTNNKIRLVNGKVGQNAPVGDLLKNIDLYKKDIKIICNEEFIKYHNYTSLNDLI